MSEITTLQDLDTGSEAKTAINTNFSNLNSDKIEKDDFNANSILKADTASTPTALTVAEQTLVGRKTGGTIDDLSASDVRYLLNVENGADVTDAENVASTIAGATAKTTPHNDDTVGLVDSEASSALKKLSWSNIKATLKTYFDTLYNNIPVGTISDFAGASAPTGWLLCDGSAISRTTYSSLFSVISTTYGSGDGSTTFNVPNAKGRVSVMKSTDAEFDTLGETGGEKAHTLTGAESGTSVHGHTGGVGRRPSAQGNDTGMVPGTAGAADYYGALQIDNSSAADASSAHNNLQPYIVFNKIIKY